MVLLLLINSFQHTSNIDSLQNNFEEPSNKLAQDNINSSRKTLFQSIQEFFSNNIESKDQNVIE